MTKLTAIFFSINNIVPIDIVDDVLQTKSDHVNTKRHSRYTPFFSLRDSDPFARIVAPLAFRSGRNSSEGGQHPVLLPESFILTQDLFAFDLHLRRPFLGHSPGKHHSAYSFQYHYMSNFPFCKEFFCLALKFCHFAFLGAGFMHEFVINGLENRRKKALLLNNIEQVDSRYCAFPPRLRTQQKQAGACF